MVSQNYRDSQIGSSTRISGTAHPKTSSLASGIGLYSHSWRTIQLTQSARPVHLFLLRHVYASTMAEYKLSKHGATLVTFFLSAAVHELVMIIVTKK